jgi:hypothetical protein
MLREKGDDFPNALMEGVALLASIYQAESEWKRAAFLLSGFRFENFPPVHSEPQQESGMVYRCYRDVAGV